MVGSIQELYNRHVKILSIEDRMQLIAITAADLAGNPQERLSKRSVMELHGLGAEIWNGIDAQEYVNAMRDEWDGSPMTIDMALNGVDRIGIDTAVVIYFVEANPQYDQVMTDVFRRISSGSLVAYTSVVTITEVLVQPYKLLNPVLAQQYRDLLLHSNNLSTIDIDSRLADDAAKLRAQYGFRTPDAFQIAVALATGCQAFLTNDTRLARVTELRVILLDELTET